MIKTLTILYLLGATCFSSASPTVGQSTLARQQLARAQNKNHQAISSWQPTPTQNENHLENGQLSRSQESDNEINENENPTGGEESSPASEDKQLPAQSANQKPQPGPNTASQSNPNKSPVTNEQKVQPLPYATMYSNGNHPPGMLPITQYSAIQMIGYQKEQTGQAPINHQQQMFYSGGSDSVPMVIYSDSERPPITMFYLGQGDKQFQGNLKTGDFIPNFQPINPQAMFYSQPQLPFSIPMPFYDPVSQPQLNSWDRQYPMFEYTPPQYYPSNNPIMKNKEIQKNDRIPQKSLKPKAAEFGGKMQPESELMDRPWMAPMPERMFVQNKNIYNPRAMNQQLIEPWMMPQRQRLAKIENMRSVVNPFWGIEPKQAMSYEWNEPMERSNLNNGDISMLESRYTSLPTSPYTSGGMSSANDGQQISSGLSSGFSGLPFGLPRSTYGGQSSSSSYMMVPSSSSYSTNEGQHSSLNQGAHNQYNSNKKPQNQHGSSQGSTSYLSPGSSQVNSGSNHGQLTDKSGSGLKGGQQQSQKQQNTQASISGTESGLNKLDQGTPFIAIIPVGVMMESQYQPSGMSNSQLLSGTDQTQMHLVKSLPASRPRDAVLRSPQWGLNGGLGMSRLGLGGSGYGSTGLNNQYGSASNAHLAGQNSGALNNQQFGHENFNTLYSQPLPAGGQIYTQVNSDKGFSGGSYGQGSQAVGLNDQNYNVGGLSSNQGYSNGVGGLGYGTGYGGGFGLGGGINLG